MEGVKGTQSKNDGVVTDGGPNKDRGEDKDRLVGKGAWEVRAQRVVVREGESNAEFWKEPGCEWWEVLNSPAFLLL